MVVHDYTTLTCEIYEIKHSKGVVESQYRHLINTEKCAETEHRFGQITGGMSSTAAKTPRLTAFSI